MCFHAASKKKKNYHDVHIFLQILKIFHLLAVNEFSSNCSDNYSRKIAGFSTHLYGFLLIADPNLQTFHSVKFYAVTK